MATTMHYHGQQPGISALDVLWAFYQSQPKSVKKAFRSRMEAEAQPRPIALWQQDLKEIKALKDNWDEEGAPRINQTAIRNSLKLMKMLTDRIAGSVRLFPTRLGAVMVSLETEKGRVKGEMGETNISYFVKRPGVATEHHSFENLTKENLSLLVHNLEAIA